MPETPEGPAPQAAPPVSSPQPTATKTSSTGLVVTILVGFVGFCVLTAIAASFPWFGMIAGGLMVVGGVAALVGKLGNLGERKTQVGLPLIIVGALGALFGGAALVSQLQEQREAEVAEQAAADQAAAEEAEQTRAHEVAEAAAQGASERIMTNEKTVDSQIKAVADAMAEGKFEQAAKIHDELKTDFALIEELNIEGSMGPSTQGNELLRRLGALRDRFRQNRDALVEKENEIFDSAFEALWDPDNLRPGANADEDKIIQRVARKHQVSTEYVDAIYIPRQDEVQKRLEARGSAEGPATAPSKPDGPHISETHVIGCRTREQYTAAIQLAASGGDPRSASGCSPLRQYLPVTVVDSAGMFASEVRVAVPRTGQTYWIAREHLEL